MTINDVITAAKSGGLPSSDLDLVSVTCLDVIPRFLNDVDVNCGNVYWRKKVLTLNPVANDRELELPTDFDHLTVLAAVNGPRVLHVFQPMEENDQEIVGTELNTTASSGLPLSYRIVHSSAAVTGDEPPHTDLFSVRFSSAFTTSATLKGIYYLGVRSNPANPSLDLDAIVPRRYQWALVDSLKAEIFKDRYDVGDKRYSMQVAKYQAWFSAIRIRRQATPSGRALYMD